MNSVSNQQTLNLLDVNQKPVILDFNGGQISSDGGILLLREVESQIGIIQSLSDVITDPKKVQQL